MPDSAHRLGILLAAPWRGESAMHNDLLAVYDALLARGLRPEELLVLEGQFDRALVLEVLASARARLAGWPAGDVFLYYSGHGAYAPLDAVNDEAAEPALIFAEDQMENPAAWVKWGELFTALSTPVGVRLSLLPDC